jgi:hypothetical protein
LSRGLKAFGRSLSTFMVPITLEVDNGFLSEYEVAGMDLHQTHIISGAKSRRPGLDKLHPESCVALTRMHGKIHFERWHGLENQAKLVLCHLIDMRKAQNLRFGAH